MEQEKNPLIFALDASDMEQASLWVDRLGDKVGLFKIGLQLFTKEGPRVVDMVHESGARVFLDLKLHDIPHTVEKASEEAGRMGVFMMNVHASGGRAMMEAALQGASKASGADPPLVIGVTVLTSLDPASMKEIGFVSSPDEVSLKLCGLARDAGLHGVVASPAEAGVIRERFGQDFTIVCPGVRPAGAEKGDQARTATPGEAVKAGADYIVVGRPIREAEAPVKAAEDILEEAMAGRK